MLYNKNIRPKLDFEDWLENICITTTAGRVIFSVITAITLWGVAVIIMSIAE